MSETLFECVNNQVIQLSHRWQIHCDLFDSGPENIELLNNSGSIVFEFFQKLIVDDAIMALSRLTDPPSNGTNKDNANIRHLIRCAQHSLAQDKIDQLHTMLKQLDGYMENVRTHRSKALAHADLNHSLGDPLPGITYDDLERAIGMCQKIMHALGTNLYDCQPNYNVTVPFGSGVPQLFTCLRKAHG